MAQPLLNSQQGVGVCSRKRGLGEKLWNHSSSAGRRRSKNIWPCSLCWTCSCSCFLLLVPKWQWHIHLSHGEKKLDFKAADYESYQKNPTTLYWGHKKNVVQHLQSWEKEVQGSKASKVACKSLRINTTWQEWFLSACQTMYFAVIFFYLYRDCLVWLTASLLVHSWGNLFCLLCLYEAEEENCR